MRKTLLLSVLILFIQFCHSQTRFSVEPVIGYAFDVNNKPAMNQLTAGVQFAWRIRRAQLVFSAQKSWSPSHISSDSSFSINPTLPLYSPAKKGIMVRSFTFGLEWRVIVAGYGKKDQLAFEPSFGINSQDIVVNYNYDKTNYTILNPDETRNATGWFAAVGFVYLHQVGNGRIFLQANIATAPSAKKNFPSTIRYIAPLSIAAGYSIPIQKHHEKN